MSRYWRTVRCAFWLLRYGYTRSPLWALRWASQQCWQDYRECGESPREAVMEDLSYAD